MDLRGNRRQESRASHREIQRVGVQHGLNLPRRHLSEYGQAEGYLKHPIRMLSCSICFTSPSRTQIVSLLLAELESKFCMCPVWGTGSQTSIQPWVNFLFSLRIGEKEQTHWRFQKTGRTVTYSINPELLIINFINCIYSLYCK